MLNQVQHDDKEKYLATRELKITINPPGIVGGYIQKKPSSQRAFLVLKDKLLGGFFNRNRDRNAGAYHRVVAHTDKAHHFDVGGNR